MLLLAYSITGVFDDAYADWRYLNGHPPPRPHPYTNRQPAQTGMVYPQLRA